MSAGATKSKNMGDLPQWVYWRAELREGKPTKIPYSPKSGTRARCGDPLTWGTLPEARMAARSPEALRLLRGLPWREVLQPGFPRRLGGVWAKLRGYLARAEGGAGFRPVRIWRSKADFKESRLFVQHSTGRCGWGYFS